MLLVLRLGIVLLLFGDEAWLRGEGGGAAAVLTAKNLRIVIFIHITHLNLSISLRQSVYLRC